MRAPDEMEDDLVDRRFDYVNRQGRILRKLEQKDVFKKRHKGRSPDDGDGAVLALAPEYTLKSLSGEPTATAVAAAFRGATRRRTP